MVALAIRTGIPVREWLAEDDPRVIDTAFDLLIEEDRASGHGGGGRRVVASG